MSEPTDSPIAWVNKHIQTYVESNGAEGHQWRGVPTLLLTVTGRKSGLPRRTALIYAEHKGDFLVVASNGGSQDHPLWYRNLVEHPEVHVQVGPREFTATARTATKEEKKRLWPVMVAIFGSYEDYRTRTNRDIPVVILTAV